MSFPEIIGIMQGRLTKPRNDKVQSFPTSNWKKEFELAAEIGFNCIEWVIDSDGIVINPLFSVSQRKTIKSMSEKYNISIPAVCHDQLMDIPLHSKDDNTAKLAATILSKTIEACESLGIYFIEIPLLGNSSLSEEVKHQRLINQLADLDSKAKESGISFILETDLTPERNASLMKSMSGLSVGLTFDMGNSAYWGFDSDYELEYIGPWIKNVHIKDCKPFIYTVPLGEGDVNFEKVMNNLKSNDYRGLFILQSAPAPLGKEIAVAHENYKFTQNKLSNFFYQS